jgi:hypothetical protein
LQWHKKGGPRCNAQQVNKGSVHTATNEQQNRQPNPVQEEGGEQGQQYYTCVKSATGEYPFSARKGGNRGVRGKPHNPQRGHATG